MTRFRKWVVTAAAVLALLMSVATVTSADPGKGRGGGAPVTTSSGCLSPDGSDPCP